MRLAKTRSLSPKGPVREVWVRGGGEASFVCLAGCDEGRGSADELGFSDVEQERDNEEAVDAPVRNRDGENEDSLLVKTQPYRTSTSPNVETMKDPSGCFSDKYHLYSLSLPIGLGGDYINKIT
jgi:hypothetical protein